MPISATRLLRLGVLIASLSACSTVISPETAAKPVLLIHGDTNAYCLDQPFSTRQAPKLWRLNAPGDYQVIDAAVIAFDPASADRPFKVTGLLSGQPAPGVCDFSRQAPAP
jgi:hypothetical protein